MPIRSPSLSEQFTRLRSNAQAVETCAWLPAAVHALIMACLDRLFGRLEHLLALWQAGGLPLPPIRGTAHRASQSDPVHRQCRPTMRASRHLSDPATSPAECAPRIRARMTSARSIPTMRTPGRTEAVAPPGTTIPFARPRPAHDPPAVKPAAQTPFCGSRWQDLFVTIS